MRVLWSSIGLYYCKKSKQKMSSSTHYRPWPLSIPISNLTHMKTTQADKLFNPETRLHFFLKVFGAQNLEFEFD